MNARGEETPTVPSDGEPVATKLLRIADKARREPKFQFTSLFHLMDGELLRGCFERLRGDAASGIDGETKAEYARNLDANLAVLVAQLHRMAYIPQAVRRTYIPKPGSDKMRPLGIPCLEDKLVQAGLVKILEQIYEADFIDGSYGFRPHRSCHDALRTLSHAVEGGEVNWIVEADIKGFFDHVHHDWLMKFLAYRIADKRVLRYIVRFLKAGIMEDGVWRASDEGTPQGGVISPLLANVYLHYALDLWFERRFQRSCRGRARLIRYADDFVVCFSRGEEAARFREELSGRLGQFALEIEPTKTKSLAFGPQAEAAARRNGQGRPETFDFLGFTHYCGRARDGRRYRMKRTTASKKFRAKVSAFKAWIRSCRNQLNTRDLWAATCRKLRGHYCYYGVTDNFRALQRYGHEVKRLLHAWLNRRGGRRMNWDQFQLMEAQFPFPRPRIRVNLLPSW
jgi:RNA-directed DNA polymerase